MLNVTLDRHARLSRARGRMARGSHHYLQSKFGSAIKGEAIKSAQGKEGARQGRGGWKDDHDARFEIARCHKKRSGWTGRWPGQVKRRQIRVYNQNACLSDFMLKTRVKTYLYLVAGVGMGIVYSTCFRSRRLT